MSDVLANESGAERPMTPGTGPLGDLLVLDLSRILTGPFATMVMGDLGARVIKVEHPHHGDDTRLWGPPFVGDGESRASTYFLSVNRNKESIALDFTDPEDLEVLRALIRRADILVENFRPGVLARLGIDHATMQQLNESLVIVSITGFGPDGPQSERAGYDQIVQGESGLMSMTGSTAENPLKVGVPIADLSAGMFGVIGALAALHERSNTGKGQVVTTSLLSSLVSLNSFQAARWLLAGEMPEPTGNAHPTVAPYGAFKCADGQLIQIAVGNDRLWERFAPTVGIDPADPRFSSNELRRMNRAELDQLIGSSFMQEPVEHWLEELAGVGIPAGEVKTLDKVYADPQVIAQGGLTRIQDARRGELTLPGSAIRLSGAPQTQHQAPPTLNEHGEEIRAWLREPTPETQVVPAPSPFRRHQHSDDPKGEWNANAI